jgi:signal transduction histidine kinase
LRTLIARFEQHSGIDASLDAPAGLDQAMSLNERHQLYRVIRQALDNVADHSQASATTIRISLDDAKLRFEIRDNGLGFSAEDERLAKMRGRMGLISMRERLLGLQGEFTIHSELDHGTSIHGWLPLAG